MLYSLTDKLSFNDDPQVEIKGKIITVKSDAETVLKLLDIVQNGGEVQGAVSAVDLLLSEKDKKTLKGLNLKIADYMKFTETIVDLALGNDPDEDKRSEQ